MISVFTKNIEGVWFGVAYNGESIYATTFASSEKQALQSLKNSIPASAITEHYESISGFANGVIGLLKDIYDGKDVSHNFSFATEHTSDYSRRVIGTVCLIPPGYVASYGSVAKVAGGSARAVGRAMALNPFPPICPCHRVVSSDFTLGGYGGGLNVKFEFLRRESRGYSSSQEIAVDGKKMQVYPVEFVLNRLRKG